MKNSGNFEERLSNKSSCYFETIFSNQKIENDKVKINFEIDESKFL
jgi:hypothetical protein